MFKSMSSTPEYEASSLFPLNLLPLVDEIRTPFEKVLQNFVRSQVQIFSPASNNVSYLQPQHENAAALKK